MSEDIVRNEAVKPCSCQNWQIITRFCVKQYSWCASHILLMIVAVINMIKQSLNARMGTLWSASVPCNLQLSPDIFLATYMYCILYLGTPFLKTLNLIDHFLARTHGCIQQYLLFKTTPKANQKWSHIAGGLLRQVRLTKKQGEVSGVMWSQKHLTRGGLYSRYYCIKFVIE